MVINRYLPRSNISIVVNSKLIYSTKLLNSYDLQMKSNMLFLLSKIHKGEKGRWITILIR